MVRELIAAGWEVDAHSLTHPDLTSSSGSALRREVAGSRERSAAASAWRPTSSASPPGATTHRVVEAVRAAGFLGATTTESGLGRAAEPFTLARVRVDGGDGAGGLARKLEALEPR